VAAEIQSMLVPKNLPNNDYIEMESIYQPHSEVGGDYYDVFFLNDMELIFCIADISGKGMAAALVMSNFQANLRALTEEDYSFQEVIIKLNTRMMRNTEGEKFITLFLGKYHLQQHTFDYVNAGHNPPYLQQENKLHPLETGTTVLGMFEELPFVETDQVQLQPKDLLFFYTDGLIDLENKAEERFKTDRLEKFLQGHRQSSPAQINESLWKQLDNYREEQSFTDDITVLTCRIKQ
jgi:sigma-B regulation protein RsbU (phosphoserine phosphatase)